MKKFLFLMAGAAFLSLSASEPVLKYDFTGDVISAAGKFARPQLSGKLAIADTGKGYAAKFNGKNFFMTVPKSDDFHFAKDGTLIMTVKFYDKKAEVAKPESLDMVIFKKDEFLLGRYHDKIYFNIKSGTLWYRAATYAPFENQDKWYHVAASFVRNKGTFHIKIYIDGALAIEKKFYNITPNTIKEPITIGKGWGGPWFFNGELANIAIYDSALSAEEIAKLAKSEKLI